MCEYRCSLSPEDFRSLDWSYWCVNIGHWEPNCPLFGEKKKKYVLKDWVIAPAPLYYWDIYGYKWFLLFFGCWTLISYMWKKYSPRLLVLFFPSVCWGLNQNLSILDKCYTPILGPLRQDLACIPDWPLMWILLYGTGITVVHYHPHHLVYLFMNSREAKQHICLSSLR